MKTNLALFFLCILAFSCEKETVIIQEVEPETDSLTVVKIDHISGFVQKGPFSQGTNITVNEVTCDLYQTGKNFYTSISSNNGSFVLNNILLSSSYAGLQANGYYFNEVSGTLSSSTLSLNALVNLKDKSTLNVNLITHLETPRVKFLVSQGLSFEDAKTQAMGEVLSVFGFETTDSVNSEQLNINKKGELNGILLAISAMLQGYRSEAELSELISALSLDLMNDGVVSDTLLGAEIMNHALFLMPAEIRQNLVDKYTSEDEQAEVPEFDFYIHQFCESKRYPVTYSLIQYPESGTHGANVLDTTRTEYFATERVRDANWLSLAADLENNMLLKIKISSLTEGALWYYELNSPRNWNVSEFNRENNTQVFTSISGGKSCDLKMFFDKGEFLVEYFEMGSTHHTKSKVVSMQ